MRKILIFYGSFGGGHLSAARNIKEYIDNNYQDTETKTERFMHLVQSTGKLT